MFGPGMIELLNTRGAFEDLLLKAERLDLYPYDEIMESCALDQLLFDWFEESVSLSDLMNEDRPVYEVFNDDWRMAWDEWPLDAYELAIEILQELLHEDEEEEDS